MDRDGSPHVGGRHRATRQRAAVITTLAALDRFSTVQEIHTRLTEQGEHAALTTVYRALQALAEAGSIDSLIGVDGHVRYRRCGQAAGPHHHLVCRSCGLTIIVEGHAVDRWARATATQHGFTAVRHELDLIGLCAECSSAG